MATFQLADALVEMADTLADDFDTADFLHALTERCVQLMNITAAGLLLADDHGVLARIAASSREAVLLQQFQVQIGQGPAVDCFRTGRSVDADNLPTDHRWPRFAIGAADAGFTAVHTVAMRLRTQSIGTLSFLTARAGPLDPRSVDTGLVLAEVATIGLLHRERIRALEVVAAQLQTALDSRILIEQAKGVLSERLGMSMSDSFNLLRQNARHRNRRLLDIARSIVDGTGLAPTGCRSSPPASPPAGSDSNGLHARTRRRQTRIFPKARQSTTQGAGGV